MILSFKIPNKKCYFPPYSDICLKLLSKSLVSLLVSEKDLKCPKMFRRTIISFRDIYSGCGSQGGGAIKLLKGEFA